MIAMQYGFVLPADYDMAIIDRRIAERGRLTDGFPGLGFKAYLTARPEGDGLFGPDTIYAPFYLWRTSEGLNDFVCGPGFATLARDFGRPRIQTWIPWAAEISPPITQAGFAVRSESAIDRDADLALLRQEAVAETRDAMRDGALAHLVAFDPTRWTTVRLALAAEAPETESVGGDSRQVFRVGHVSVGQGVL